MRVLLVDDDPEIRLIAGFLLRQAGHDVVEADGTAAALAAAASGRPDVVLMDVMLGDEDGVELADRVRGLTPHPPPVVFLSGVAREEQLQRLRAAGPAGIIRKPFDPASFAGDVAALLEAAR
jgi:CheY-like chemotaxis protein